MATSSSTMHQKPFLRQFILSLAFLATTALKISAGRPAGSPFGSKMTMLHRSQLQGQNVARADLFRHMLNRDRDRMQKIMSAQQGGETTMRAGAYIGSGEYLVDLKVGTPAQLFRVVADTGSNLVWVNRRNSISSEKTGFRPGKSTSFRDINCHSDICVNDIYYVFGNRTGCLPSSQKCGYNYSYVGGAANGFFMNETVTFDLTNGLTTQLQNTVMGLGEKIFDLDTFLKGTDGVVGLSPQRYSLPDQASKLFGKRAFSYCLVDHLSDEKATSKLYFGAPPSLPKGIQYTALDLTSHGGQFYAVNIMGIKINGTMLKFPKGTWNNSAGNGAIIDSGTSLTFFSVLVYNSITKPLNQALSKFMPVVKDDTFEFCYKSSKGYVESKVPKLDIVFENGAVLSPQPKSYLIDVADGKKCLGLGTVDAGPNVPVIASIGNIMQQELCWLFDIENRRLGFGKFNRA